MYYQFGYNGLLRPALFGGGRFFCSVLLRSRVVTLAGTSFFLGPLASRRPFPSTIWSLTSRPRERPPRWRRSQKETRSAVAQSERAPPKSCISTGLFGVGG